MSKLKLKFEKALESNATTFQDLEVGECFIRSEEFFRDGRPELLYVKTRDSNMEDNIAYWNAIVCWTNGEVCSTYIYCKTKVRRVDTTLVVHSIE